MKNYIINIGKITITLIIFVISMSTTVVGDIAPPEARGETMQPINMTNVQMVNETVHIVMCVENATVKCNFTLVNLGENESLLVGFPVGLGWDFGDDGSYTYPLEDFKAYIDSKPMETERMEVNGSPWMVWNMSFDEMEVKDVGVSYWVPLSYYGNYGRMARHWFTYVLKTGAAWRGVIDEANITVELHGIEPDWITEISPEGYVSENYTITWNFTSIEPTENIYIQFETLHEQRYTIPGEIIYRVYGEPLVTTTSNGTYGAVGEYSLTNLSDEGGWIYVVCVAHTLDAAGNERTGFSAPIEFCPFLGWDGRTVNVAIGDAAQKGDINHDDAVTPADAAIALQIASGSRECNSAADINDDGQVTAVDALMIMQAAIGNIVL